MVPEHAAQVGILFSVVSTNCQRDSINQSCEKKNTYVIVYIKQNIVVPIKQNILWSHSYLGLEWQPWL